MTLITGANGFIGRYLQQRLNSFTTDFEHADYCGDLSDASFVHTLPEVDTVIHLAALNSTSHFYTTPYDVLKSIVVPTMNLLERYPTAHFVFAGTSESYAGGVNAGFVSVPTAEDTPLIIDDITNTRWSYASAKTAMESAVISHAKQFNHTYNIARFHNVYGQGQRNHFIPEFYERVRRGDFNVPGADESRSFCYIDDAIDLFMSVFDIPNKIFHIGSDVTVNIFDAASEIAELAGVHRDQLVPVEGCVGSVKARQADLTKIKSVIGEYRFTSFKEGVRKTLL